MGNKVQSEEVQRSCKQIGSFVITLSSPDVQSDGVRENKIKQGGAFEMQFKLTLVVVPARWRRREF